MALLSISLIFLRLGRRVVGRQLIRGSPFLELLSALNEQKLVSRSSAAHFYEDFLFDARGLPVLFN